jgi:hypothetical protein
MGNHKQHSYGRNSKYEGLLACHLMDQNEEFKDRRRHYEREIMKDVK